MEKTIEQGILYDFCGELLMGHQRQIYEDVVFNDLSLSETVREQGTSRQGVHDLIKQCDKILAEYEEKSQFIHKSNEAKQRVADIRQLTKQYQETEDVSPLRGIEEITGDIIEL